MAVLSFSGVASGGVSPPIRYEVRTPMAVWLANGVVLFLTIALFVLAFGVGSMPIHMLVLLAVLAFASVTFWFSMGAYRIGGGRNLIRFHTDRMDVPGAHPATAARVPARRDADHGSRRDGELPLHVRLGR